MKSTMRGDYHSCWSVSPQTVIQPGEPIRRTGPIGDPDNSVEECLHGRLADGGVTRPCYQRYVYRQRLFGSLSSDTKID